ncbi:MAG: Holliday junction branch migration protein RuvA [Bacilli bacterium]
MYSYIIGRVVQIESNYLVLENNNIGYLINCANPYSFTNDEEYKIYLYQQVREDELNLFGFKTIEEKEMFLKLISVKGLGCKMALPILATGTPEGIIDAIERENILYLKKFPKIGDKIARQIILDLKGKLVSKEEASSTGINNDELVDALKGLGYKPTNINKIVSKIDNELSLEEQLREALKLLLK